MAVVVENEIFEVKVFSDAELRKQVSPPFASSEEPRSPLHFLL